MNHWLIKLMELKLPPRLHRGMRIAVSAADASQHRMRVGAAIYKNSMFYSSGHNSYTGKTHPKSNAHCRTIHAELHALLRLGLLGAKKTTIYVARLRKDNSLGMSKPCTACQELLRFARVKKMVFVNYHGNVEEQLL